MTHELVMRSADPSRSQPHAHVVRRVIVVLATLLLLSMAAVVLSVSHGAYYVAPADVARTILGMTTSSPDHQLVVLQFRLPRTVAAYLVGMALALAGAILQALTRNPLAAPDIIGVTAGSGLAAVALLLVLPGVSVAALPPAAFVGGAVAALLIYGLAWRGGDSPNRLVLVGIGMAAIISAFTTLLLTFGNMWLVGSALIWLTGSVHGRTWDHVQALLPWLIVGMPLALLLASHLNVLVLGDSIARSLGMSVIRSRALLLATAVALAAAAVATAGVIGFVGLLAPHMARRLVGTQHQHILPTAALLGGLIIALADLVGRVVAVPIEIPCGIVTAVLGAPYFLYLLARGRRQRPGGSR